MEVERVLGYGPFMIAGMTIAFIFFMCIINMYLLARYRTSRYTILIHLLSFFAVGSMIFYLVGSAVFVHPLSKFYYRMAQRTFFTVAIGVGLSGLGLLGIRQKYSMGNITSNISYALSNITDVVFVADLDGMITYINHPEKYSAIFEDTAEQRRLRHYIEENCQILNREHNAVKEIKTSEMHMEKSDRYFVLLMAPIVVKNSPMGYTVVLEDVSNIRLSERVLQQQNERLNTANIKLSQYLKTVDELETERARLSILTEIQEMLILDIEKSLGTIRHIRESDFESGIYQESFKKLAEQLRKVYEKVRRTVGQIAGKEVKP